MAGLLEALKRYMQTGVNEGGTVQDYLRNIGEIR